MTNKTSDRTRGTGRASRQTCASPEPESNAVFESVACIRQLGVTGWLRRCRHRRLRILQQVRSEIWREPRGIAAGYRWPQFSIHRGALQTLLLEECHARIGAHLHAGCHLESFEQDASGVTARFIDKGTGALLEEHYADLLVAADGSQSRRRCR